MGGRRSGSFGSMVIGGVIVVAAVIVGLPFAWKWLGSPFTTTTVDRTPPPVIVELRDLADFRAATGQFEVLVDLERDVKYVPSFLAGERVIFVGVGDVEASVDFARMDDDAIVLSDDGLSAVITLPAPTLRPAVIDPERSHVMDRDRGLFDRVTGMLEDNPTGEQELYLLAADKIDAAAAASELSLRAEENTRSMLVAMLRQLGVEQVTVQFTDRAEEPVPAVP